MKQKVFLTMTLFLTMNAPATFAVFLGTGKTITKGVEIDAVVKPNPGNADNLGAVAVSAQVTVEGPMWAYCVNSPVEGTFSGNAGASIETIDPAQSFTSDFSVCEPNGGSTCGSISITNIVGVGQPSQLCPNQQNWILVDGVPQFATIHLEELHCLNGPGGSLIACDANHDNQPDAGVYLQLKDVLNMDCALSNDVFVSFEFGDRELYTCTEF